MDFFKLSKMRRPTGSGRGRRRKGAERGEQGRRRLNGRGVESGEGGRKGGRKREGGGEGRGGRMKEVNTAMKSDEPCIKDYLLVMHHTDT